MSTGNRVAREGISAGLIGATAIAVWFAILDATRGELLATPVMLGSSLGSLFLQGDTPGKAAAFIGYTLFHVAIFCVIGYAFSWVVNSAEKVPSSLIGFAGLFIVFEVGWIGWTSVLSQGFGEITWLQVFLANLIGSGAMGAYMWRQHPTLPRRVGAQIAGAPERTANSAKVNRAKNEERHDKRRAQTEQTDRSLFPPFVFPAVNSSRFSP